MEKKIIFFDVDGTLVSDTGGIEHVPESAKRAIALTRAKGNLVYLCTGRSKAEIYDFILECGIDGVIGAGGGYIEIGNQMLYHKKVTNKYMVIMKMILRPKLAMKKKTAILLTL